MPGPTLDQRRANHAWQTVNAVSPGDRDKFKTESKKLPVRIMTAGLGQSLAFLNAKGEARHLVNRLEQWVAERLPGSSQDLPLMERIVNEDSVFLMRATEESMQWLQWVSRFAEAAISEE